MWQKQPAHGLGKVMTDINLFVNRLEKIGIEIELALNYPWIYLDKINGKKITEKYNANHGFCIGYHTKMIVNDKRAVFNKIREVLNKEKLCKKS